MRARRAYVLITENRAERPFSPTIALLSPFLTCTSNAQEAADHMHDQASTARSS